MAIDWEKMFLKYAEILDGEEGQAYLISSDWTPEEWEAIKLNVGPAYIRHERVR